MCFKAHGLIVSVYSYSCIVYAILMALKWLKIAFNYLCDNML